MSHGQARSVEGRPYVVGRDSGEADTYQTEADAKRAAHQHIAVNGPHSALVFKRLGNGALERIDL